MKRLYPFFPLLLAVLCACNETPKTETPPPPPEPVAVDTAPFQAIIDSVYAEFPRTRAVMMHIEAPDQGVSWCGAVGMADSATNREANPNDPALIASNTKTYVSVAMMRLAEMGQIDLFQPIGGLLQPHTDSIMRSDGYDLDVINIAHLLSHTSGMFDYVNSPNYLDLTTAEPDHEWTRDDQILLSVTDGDPLAAPGDHFQYGDINYLLCTEIIELKTGKPFYVAMRDLLKYNDLNLGHTWFNLLEEAPSELSPLVHQYASSFKVDSYTLHGTFDLYGGGGIVSTTTDLARFFQATFSGELFDNPETSQMLYTEITTKDSNQSNYYMGIGEKKIGDFTVVGHGGFWGTTAQYFPELNASVAVFVLDRDEWKRYNIVLEEVAKRLKHLGTHSDKPKVEKV